MPAPPCPPALWPRVSARLDEALDLPIEARAAWLAKLAGEEAELRPYLERLLSTPARQRIEAPRLRMAAAPALAAGQCIGGYRLERLLGTGGMGEVWFARAADGHLQRPVALKLPHAFLLAGTLRARFERERDILAALAHPHIAALYDAGVDGDHPWLAMEAVDGEPLTAYCRRRASGLDERLALFAQVLAAVEHAHTRFVAHRDLKPSNILVTADGSVKLLDFGIAKLLGEQGQGEATELTRLGGAAATPEYAAPEQLARGSVTVASDVYALGVVLYELLAGQRPFAAGTAPERRGEPPALANRIEPGQRVGTLSPRALRRALAGDLDAIVARALEPDPERRYRSAAALADDLARHRRLEPVQARAIGPATRLLRLMRRHRLGAALTGALVLSLGAGVAGVAWQGWRAEQAAERAREQAELANRVSRYLVSLFDTLSPERTGGRPVDPRVLVDAGRRQLDRDLPEGSPLRARLLGTLGVLYEHLGYNQDAIAALGGALTGGAQTLDREVAREFWYELGRAHQGLEQRRDARAAFEQALALRRGLPEDRESAQIQAALGLVLLRDGAVAEALARLQAALAVQRRERDAGGAARSLMYLSEAYTAAGDGARARQAIDEALALQAAAGGRQDAAYLRILSFKVDQLYFNEESMAAEALAREALEAHRRVFGELSQPTNDLHFRLATILYDQGKVREALDHMREVARYEREQGAVSDPSHAQTLDAIGRYELALGEIDAALADAREANRLWSLSREGRSRFSEIARLNLGRALIAAGREREAESTLAPELPAALEGKLADQSRARRCLLLGELALQRGAVEAAADWLDCNRRLLPDSGGHKLQQLERAAFAARLLARRGQRAAAFDALRARLGDCARDYAAEAPWCLAVALDALECAPVGAAAFARSLLARIGPEIERTQGPAAPLRARWTEQRRRWAALPSSDPAPVARP